MIGSVGGRRDATWGSWGSPIPVHARVHHAGSTTPLQVGAFWRLSVDGADAGGPMSGMAGRAVEGARVHAAGRRAIHSDWLDRP